VVNIFFDNLFILMEVHDFKRIFVLIILFGTILFIFIECIRLFKCNCLKCKRLKCKRLKCKHRVRVQPVVVIGTPMEIINHEIVVIGQHHNEQINPGEQVIVVDGLLINNSM